MIAIKFLQEREKGGSREHREKDSPQGAKMMPTSIFNEGNRRE